VVTAVLLVVVLVAIGRVVYGVSVPTTTIGGALLALFVGAFAFSALGFALTRVIRSENAAAPITNAIILPLYFISGRVHPRRADSGRRAQGGGRLPGEAALRRVPPGVRSGDEGRGASTGRALPWWRRGASRVRSSLFGRSGGRRELSELVGSRMRGSSTTNVVRLHELRTSIDPPWRR
jgi:ABC-2 type transporter.